MPFLQKLFFHFAALVLIVWPLCATTALAQMVADAPAPTPSKFRCYKLKDDTFAGRDKHINRYPVCKVMEDNLNRFCDQPRMMCELKIHPAFAKQLKLPTWKPMKPSLEKAKDFVMAATAKHDGGRWPQEKWEESWLKGVESGLRDRTLFMDRAAFDMLNRGSIDEVWRLRTGECNPLGQMSEHGYLEYPDDSLLMTNLAPSVFRGRSKPKGFPVDANHMFFYKNKTYDYSFGVNSGTISLYNDSAFPSSKNVCYFKYYESLQEMKNDD